MEFIGLGGVCGFVLRVVQGFLQLDREGSVFPIPLLRIFSLFHGGIVSSGLFWSASIYPFTVSLSVI